MVDFCAFAVVRSVSEARDRRAFVWLVRGEVPRIGPGEQPDGAVRIFQQSSAAEVLIQRQRSRRSGHHRGLKPRGMSAMGVVGRVVAGAHSNRGFAGVPG